MLKKTEYSIAATEAITYEEGKFWYVSYWDNIIRCMDGETYETTLLCKVDENIKEGLFSQAVSYKNKIYFVPRLAKAITVYDKEENTTYKLDFLKENEVITGSKFYTSIMDGDFLYLIPCNYYSVICINLKDDSIDVVRVNSKEACECICGGGAVKFHDEILFPYETENCIVAFDFKDKIIQKIYPDNWSRKYTHVFNIRGKIWLIPFDINNGIIIWDREENIIEATIPFPQYMMPRNYKQEFEKFPEEIRKQLESYSTRYFGKSYQRGGEIHLLSSLIGENVVINTSNKVITGWNAEIECSDEILYTYLRSIKLINYIETEDGLYAISGVTGEWFHYIDGEWTKIIKQHIKIRNLIKDTIYIEGKLFEFNNGQSYIKTENCGEKIYKDL